MSVDTDIFYVIITSDIKSAESGFCRAIHGLRRTAGLRTFNIKTFAKKAKGGVPPCRLTPTILCYNNLRQKNPRKRILPCYTRLAAHGRSENILT